jgi:hypothetical protein
MSVPLCKAEQRIDIVLQGEVLLEEGEEALLP